MYIPSRDDLLQLYENDVKSAYADRLDGYRRYLENREGSLRQMASHCGAELGAAHKRCKRDLVFSFLQVERLNGLDIGVVRRNPRNFRQPSSSPATSASRSMNLPSVWKV
ncbi:hypothetical protein [Pseudomonas kurunegalensis]|uniref:hypothetical protein n=2 Tax=Pseudomonas kurunegalensis TaxID=485880 RepID=UPI002119A40C|nr:hypothetical protein [Pseudomonas kurunegalensis]